MRRSAQGAPMTGTTPSSHDLDPRRRKLLFRSWHRGMRETDLILGSFADARIDALTEAELDQYEGLLDIPDTVLLPWITGEQPVPDRLQSEILQKIVAFRQAMTFR
jgi:antitoxin CptB